MRDAHRRPVLRQAVLALCAAVAVGTWKAPACGEEPVALHADATPPAPPFIEARPGEMLPDWLLEDGRGRRFHLSETRGKPLVLTVRLATLKWDQGVRAIQAVAGNQDRAAVLHLTAVPSTSTEDAPGAPLVPAWDIAQQHRDDAAWLASVGEDLGRAVRRLPRWPADGARPWRLNHGGQTALVVITDAAGVVQQVFLPDTATRAHVGWAALLDAAVACAGGGSPVSEDGRGVLASRLLEACAPPNRPSRGPDPARPGERPAASPFSGLPGQNLPGQNKSD